MGMCERDRESHVIIQDNEEVRVIQSTTTPEWLVSFLLGEPVAAMKQECRNVHHQLTSSGADGVLAGRVA